MTEITARRNPNRPPTHPGVLLNDTVLPALGRPKTEIARLLGISRQSRSDILAGEQPVTPTTAINLAKLRDNGPLIWMNIQTANLRAWRGSTCVPCRVGALDRDLGLFE